MALTPGTELNMAGEPLVRATGLKSYKSSFYCVRLKFSRKFC